MGVAYLSPVRADWHPLWLCALAFQVESGFTVLEPHSFSSGGASSGIDAGAGAGAGAGAAVVYDEPTADEVVAALLEASIPPCLACQLARWGGRGTVAMRVQRCWCGAMYVRCYYHASTHPTVHTHIYRTITPPGLCVGPTESKPSVEKE
jgi:hypothetical protein